MRDVDEPARPAASSCCNCKAITKFCLLYYITLNLVMLLFAAFNQESLTRTQLIWFWAYLGSVFLTVSLAITSMIIIVWTDYNVLASEPEQNNIEGAKPELITDKNDENSASFKTILTINSSLPGPDKLEPPPQLQTLKAQPFEDTDTSAFVNLTPAIKSPVTLIDMKKGKLDKKLAKKMPKASDQSIGSDTSNASDSSNASNTSNASNASEARKLAAEANLAVIPSDVLTKESKERANFRPKHTKRRPRAKRKAGS